MHRRVDPLVPAADEPLLPGAHHSLDAGGRRDRHAPERVAVEVDAGRVVVDEASAESGERVGLVEGLRSLPPVGHRESVRGIVHPWEKYALDMPRSLRTRFGLAVIVTISALATVLASSALATAPPIGPLPGGPTSKIHTQPGQLVAVALPHRAGGRVWRVAGAFDGSRLREVSEADVGPNVVLVFRALRAGNATLSFGLTRGERPKAYESRQYVVMIAPE